MTALTTVFQSIFDTVVLVYPLLLLFTAIYCIALIADSAIKEN